MWIAIIGQCNPRTNSHQVAPIRPLFSFLVRRNAISTQDKLHLGVDFLKYEFSDGGIESLFTFCTVFIKNFYITTQAIHYDWFVGYNMMSIDLGKDCLLY